MWRSIDFIMLRHISYASPPNVAARLKFFVEGKPEND
jgi:hypothetical protein